MSSIFTTKTMLRAIEIMVDHKRLAPSFLTRMFFRKEETFSTEEVKLDIRRGKRRIAPIVRRQEPAKLMQQTGYETQTIIPAYVNPLMETDASKLLKKAPGQIPYGKVNVAKKAKKKLGEEISELIGSIIRRVEVMASQVVTTGKVLLVGETVNQEVDFKVDAAGHIRTLTGAEAWNNASSNPISKIREWKKDIVKKTGYQADFAIVSDDTLEALEQHEKTLKLMDNRRVSNIAVFDRKNDGSLPNGVTWVGRIEAVDLYTYHEWYVEPTTGVTTPMIPDKMFILGCSKNDNHILYGAIEDHEAIMESKWYPRSWREENPPRRFVQVHSAPLATLNIPESIMIAKVLP